MAQQRRQPRGRPVGGQFAGTEHPEADVEIAVAALPPEAIAYGPVPDPEPGMTFAQAWAQHFRELDEHEAVQGPYEKVPGPSDERLRELAGLQDADLGRVRAFDFEQEEHTGEPLIRVHTRNGGGNRECWEEHDEDEHCTACTMARIPDLPTYVRDRDDEGDRTYADIWFRPAGDAEAEELREALLHHRLFGLSLRRRFIRDGKEPPWGILPAQPGRDPRPYSLTQAKRRAADKERHCQAWIGLAEKVLAAGEESGHEGSLGFHDGTLQGYTADAGRIREELAKLDEARSDARELQAELDQPLPPRARQLVDRALQGTTTVVALHEGRIAEARGRMAAAERAIRSRLIVERKQAEEARRELSAAEAGLEHAYWSLSWPGPVEECPPRRE